MPFGGDSFEHYRRGQRMRQLEHELRSRLNSANEEIVRRIQDDEAIEELERRVADEMREFFRFSTRLAAKTLAELQRRQSEEIESKLEQEIEGFFEETKARAMSVIAQVKKGSPEARAALVSLLAEPVQQVTGADLATRPSGN